MTTPSTPEAKTVGTRPRRYTEFEAYRGVAAALVVIFHAYQFTRQGTGADRYLYEGTPLHTVLHNLDTPVAWFFALSGFLLYAPVVGAVVRGGSAQPARVFVFRRALRILPLYLTVYLVVWALRFSNFPGQWTDLVEHLTFTHVWDARYVFWTVGPAWSLGNEVIYYAMLAVMGPALARATRGATRADRARWVVAFPLALVTLGVTYKAAALLALNASGTWFDWTFNPVAHVDSFAMGMLLACVPALSARVLSSGARALLIVLAVALTAFTFVFRLELAWVSVFVFSLAGAAFTLFLAATVLAPEGGRFARALSRPTWVHLGLISYGVYLWHEPIMLEFARRGWLIGTAPSAFWTNALVLLVVAGALASLTYRLVERPFEEARGLMTSSGRLRDDYRLERERYERERERERGPGD
ncbi:acyltransferase family protein [Deinococcus pimensis]|uniref:acyltransferase family protein n=1 Tax=Deinococcus pimensis TaxID=309888 RepID=UPI0004B3BC46|nr:acyltransferase [Deinococcus pimensis]